MYKRKELGFPEDIGAWITLAHKACWSILVSTLKSKGVASIREIQRTHFLPGASIESQTRGYL